MLARKSNSGARIAAVVLLAATACEEGNAKAPPAAPAAYAYVLLLDRSDGVQDRSGRACEVLQKISTTVTQVIAAKDDGRSFLQAYASGTKDMLGTVTLLDPARRERVGPPPVREDSIEESQKRFEAVEARWQERKRGLEDAWRQVPAAIAESCRKNAMPVRYSPLFATLRAGLEQCAKAKDMRCEVIFVTDLQETAEAGICTAIWGKSPECPKGGASKLPDPLDARGATVRICGLTQSRDAPGAKLTDAALARLKDVWRKLVVNAAELELADNCNDLRVN